jgi:predicted class III extradiol MEMO1 family dioxygenase
MRKKGIVAEIRHLSKIGQKYKSQRSARRISMKEYLFMRHVKEVLQQSNTMIIAPPITFEFSTQAAIRNWET